MEDAIPKVKIEKLTDAQLDHFCAIAHGWTKANYKPNVVLWLIGADNFIGNYHPTTNATQCYEIQEREKIGVVPLTSEIWESEKSISPMEIIVLYGATAKQAIIRCFVKYKLGEEVEV